MILISLVSEKTKERGWVIVGTLIPPIIGWSLLATIQQNNSPNTNYGILYL